MLPDKFKLNLLSMKNFKGYFDRHFVTTETELGMRVEDFVTKAVPIRKESTLTCLFPFNTEISCITFRIGSGGTVNEKAELTKVCIFMKNCHNPEAINRTFDRCVRLMREKGY